MARTFPRTGFAVPVMDHQQDYGDTYSVSQGSSVFLYTVHNVDRRTALLIGLLRGAESVYDLAAQADVPVLTVEAVAA